MDGTIADLETGLLWEKKTEDGSVHDVGNEYSWTATGTAPDGTVFTDFLATLNGEGFAGHTDWRIPNIKELHSIVDYSNHDPSIHPDFGPTVSSGYMSATTWARSPSFAWRIYFEGGDTTRLDFPYVRAVRSGSCDGFVALSARADGGGAAGEAMHRGLAGDGQDDATFPLPPPSNHGPALAYEDCLDGTIADLETGLLWEKKTEDGSVHDVDNLYSWWSATGTTHGTAFTDFLDTLNGEGFAGHSDWRMPNVKELLSIVDYSKFSPSIHSDFGPTGLADVYWSATSFGPVPFFHWEVSFTDGDVEDLDVFEAHMRAVRSGSCLGP